MNHRYIVFDVETPNAYNNRISAIGITVVDGYSITDEMLYLVNPQTHFDYFNIQLTGISPQLVQDKPSFEQLWEKIKPLMGSGILVAHNAPFDMGVLAKCLNHYQINWKPYAYYACTCKMGKAMLPGLQNHKLNTVANHLGIYLNHHDAGSDSHACAKMLIHYLQSGISIDSYIRKFDIEQQCTLQKPFRGKSSVQSDVLLELRTMLSEIISDGVLSYSEIMALQSWLSQNEQLKGQYPFDKVFEVVRHALADGVLDGEKSNTMLAVLDQVADPVQKVCLCDLSINGKTFCLTGEFAMGDRYAVEDALVQSGGICVKSVTAKTNLVIVGSKGSSAWCAGNYGSKIKKALEMQEKGSGIQIVKEQDLFESSASGSQKITSLPIMKNIQL